ncbi:MAG: HAD-IIA family hydrolase [Deltaproteobacteria bacterium]|nr:HAD-IIA family hydrolase [Deltaproteobacteria bacterium]
MDEATRTLLSGLQLFLVDQDGTVYLGEELLPGARRFFELLAGHGRDYLFLSNNSSRDAGSYVAKLSRLGLPVTPRQVMTSGDATTGFLAARMPGARLFLLGTPSLEGEFSRAGFTLVQEPASPATVDAVVLGFDRTLTYRKLEIAARLLLAGLPYFATHADLVCPTLDGPIPDAGSMIALLQQSTGRKPQVIGKPEPRLVRLAMERFGRTVGETAVIGDRLYTDMEMGHRAGITSLLVLSGETKELSPGGDPRVTLSFANLGELAEALEEVWAPATLAQR